MTPRRPASFTFAIKWMMHLCCCRLPCSHMATTKRVAIMWFCLRWIRLHPKSGLKVERVRRNTRLIYLFGFFISQRPTSSCWCWVYISANAFFCVAVAVQTIQTFTYLKKKMLVNSRRRIVRISLIFFSFFSPTLMPPWNKSHWMWTNAMQRWRRRKKVDRIL